MGAWGEKAFQNDAALDWLGDLEARGVVELRRALSRVADTDEEDEVDVDDGAAAIAAAEIVAAALGHGRDRLTDAAASWLDSHQGGFVAEDLSLALRAVKRVLDGESELRALWDESGSDSAWHGDVRMLLARLARHGGASEPAANRRERSPRKTDERGKQVLLTFLRARGLEPTAKQMERIRSSQDPAEIRRWLGRAANAPSVAAVLDD